MRKYLSIFILFLSMVTFNISGFSQNGIGGNNLLSGLSPETFWQYFNEITKIPRCSGNEEEIRQWVVEQAESLGLDVFVDEYGNVKIEKSASKGYEDHEGVVLQGHLDMVCSPADMTFPLQLEINGGWLTANNTTLGADNGVGIALALTVLADSSIKHPPLEVLFTVEEETGLDGAKNLREDFIRYR
ncbi:MAG: M20/M25/M40 family metallo-hydrolase, partial [Deferribacterota bacterium]|nr:M20/M25/M40 family metallo-hydrolase [Deferribacterota bacterium]